ncbi:probable metal-binding protein [Formivibrio citricus]|uniref:Probable metal-binding protein n=1 Tax=Formivibrio citricus TaxID=83765 RepID=A0A1I4XH68_9NEIS|nr:YecH family metal-binding protein [Formivibrio citricus]SFN24843.1 probable metal-binding protein [Formivibrio citricus]
MSTSVHGHEVMHFMLEKGGSFTKESLQNAIIERFGADTRFHTCSAEGMTAAELIDFLAAKGKFIEDDAGFNTQPDKICNH